MCGLFGIIYRDSSLKPSYEHLLGSAQQLRHRGPDAEGVYADMGIGLAHRRLALLDLDARSDQPFWDDTGRYCLVYNGEIYNYKELRAELRERHVAFRTTSDTEVLLQCILNDDPETVLPRLEGMFAFAVYDTAAGSLLLARDRFGMKPLYVYDDGRIFAFASEIKAFRPWVALEADEFSISSYLLGFGGPTAGFTFYRSVKSVAPGSLVRFDRDKPVTNSRFFSLSDFWDRGTIDNLERLRPVQMVDTMEETLLKSVEKHLFADSPVGAFCSGGVDSSLLVAMAATMHNDLAIFHANVKGRWSEYDAAQKLAQHLRLDLLSVDVNEHDFVELLPDVMKHYEHPYTYHPNCAPMFMVCKLARDHNMKGLLSGEGSDECFLGYPWLGRERVVNAYYRALDRLRLLVHKVPHVGKILWPHEGNAKAVVQDLLNRCEIAEDEQRTRDMVRAMAPARISKGNLWTVDYLNYHLRTLLHRNDSMGMAASIEARFPYLDHEVVHVAANMPSRYKLRFSPMVFEKAHPWVRDKWVVRKVADRYVPSDLSQRIKIGFWTTAFQRMRVATTYFEDSYVRELFGLTPKQMEIVASEADQDLTMRLLHLDIWGQVCLRALDSPIILNKLRDHISLIPESAHAGTAGAVYVSP
jgi:asparagine synthase (glutamine-hydrolysing)